MCCFLNDKGWDITTTSRLMQTQSACLMHRNETNCMRFSYMKSCNVDTTASDCSRAGVPETQPPVSDSRRSHTL